MMMMTTSALVPCVSVVLLFQVERMVASVLYFKGLKVRQNPRYGHLNRYDSSSTRTDRQTDGLSSSQ